MIYTKILILCGVICSAQAATMLYSNSVDSGGDWDGAAWSPTTGPVFLTASVGLSPTAGSEIMLLAENFGGSGTTAHSFTVASAPVSDTLVVFSVDVGNFNNAPFPTGGIAISIQDSSMATIATLTGADPASSTWESWSASVPTALVPAGSYTALINFTPDVSGFDNAGIDNFTVTSIPEPTSGVLLGLTSLTLLARRKR